MQRIDVKAGERVIKQGDSGDRFYVVGDVAVVLSPSAVTHAIPSRT